MKRIHVDTMAEQRHSRIFVVLNPMAGSGTAEDVRQALDRHFAASAWQQEIYETTGEEQIPDIVRGARAAKRRFGRAAYLWTAARWLIGYQPRRFTIAVDGRRYRPRAAQVLIANGGALGMRLLRWGPHIRPDDGQVDVCVISARTLWDYLRVGWHMLLSQHDRDPNIRYLSATRSIAIDADRPLPVQADGEIIGQTPVQVRVVPDAVRVVVPRANVEPTQQPAEMD